MELGQPKTDSLQHVFYQANHLLDSLFSSTHGSKKAELTAFLGLTPEMVLAWQTYADCLGKEEHASVEEFDVKIFKASEYEQRPRIIFCSDKLSFTLTVEYHDFISREILGKVEVYAIKLVGKEGKVIGELQRAVIETNPSLFEGELGLAQLFLSLINRLEIIEIKDRVVRARSRLGNRSEAEMMELARSRINDTRQIVYTAIRHV